jgi:hypothetical protein
VVASHTDPLYVVQPCVTDVVHSVDAVVPAKLVGFDWTGHASVSASTTLDVRERSSSHVFMA